MNKFRERDSGGYGGGRKFGGGGGGSRPPWKKSYHDDDDRERPAMHHATCDKCGKDCEVPFVPSGKKPVFCRDCFVKEDAGGPSKFGGKPSFRGPSFAEKSAPQVDYRQSLQAIADKLDVIANALAALAGQVTVVEDEPDMDEPIKEPVEEAKPKKKAKAKKKK